MILALTLLACDTGPSLEEVTAECVPEGHFDDLFVFEAWTSGDVTQVSLRMVLQGDEWSLLPLSEEDKDYWTGEMWGSTANADCLALEDVIYRFVATASDGAEVTVDLAADSGETLP